MLKVNSAVTCNGGGIGRRLYGRDRMSPTADDVYGSNGRLILEKSASGGLARRKTNVGS